MIDLRQIYYNINFMSSNIYLLLQELGDIFSCAGLIIARFCSAEAAGIFF